MFGASKRPSPGIKFCCTIWVWQKTGSVICTFSGWGPNSSAGTFEISTVSIILCLFGGITWFIEPFIVRWPVWSNRFIYLILDSCPPPFRQSSWCCCCKDRASWMGILIWSVWERRCPGLNLYGLPRSSKPMTLHSACKKRGAFGLAWLSSHFWNRWIANLRSGCDGMYERVLRRQSTYCSFCVVARSFWGMYRVLACTRTKSVNL